MFFGTNFDFEKTSCKIELMKKAEEGFITCKKGSSFKMQLAFLNLPLLANARYALETSNSE